MAHENKDLEYTDLESLAPDSRLASRHNENLSGSQDRYMIKNEHLRECIAECLGTFIMASFGLAGSAQVQLTNSSYGNFTQVTFCWGIGVLFGIHASGGVSGGHLNPAVTTTLAVFHLLPWHKVPGYMFSQVLGAFLAALMVYITYRPLLNEVDPERTTSYTVFVTHPNTGVSTGTAFFTEMFATTFVTAGTIAVLDPYNRPASPSLAPAAVALLLTGIGQAFSYNTSAALNPARDFGPRLALMVAGWGSDVFTVNDYYFWVPIVGPITGGVIGGIAYYCLVAHHHPNKVAMPRRQHKF